jgi:tetratricopeptide (TPR) repeat protein
MSGLLTLRLAYLTDAESVSDTNSNVCDLSLIPTENYARAQSLCARLRALRCSSDISNLEETAQNAADTLPDDSYLRENLSIVQLKLHKWQPALANLFEAIRLNPTDSRHRYLFSFALNANSRPEEAKEQLRYGYSLDPEGWNKITRYFESRSLSPCPGVPVPQQPPGPYAVSIGEPRNTGSDVGREQRRTPRTSKKHIGLH